MIEVFIDGVKVASSPRALPDWPPLDPQASLVDQLHDALCRSVSACGCKVPNLCPACTMGLEALSRYDPDATDDDPFVVAYGPDELPARDRHQATRCEDCEGRGWHLPLGPDSVKYDRVLPVDPARRLPLVQLFNWQNGVQPPSPCRKCQGTGYRDNEGRPLFGYALFSPDGEQLSDMTGEAEAIVLAAAACHGVASRLGAAREGGFSLIRSPTGQRLSDWLQQNVERANKNAAI